MSSIVASALPLIDRIIPKLPDCKNVEVDLLLANWLPQDHPRRFEPLSRVHRSISSSLQKIKLHEYLPRISASYKQAKAWVSNVKDTQGRFLGYCQLALLYPEKAHESLRIIKTLKYSDEFDARAPYEETYLQLCLKNLPDDCEVAFKYFLKSITHEDSYEAVVKAFTTNAPNKGKFLVCYLELINRKPNPEQKKYARAIIKKIVAINPAAAIAYACAAQNKNIATAQICLVVARSQLTTNAVLAEKLLQKAESCNALLPNDLEASELCDSNCQQFKTKAAEAAKASMLTKLKTARLLYPNHPQKALDMLLEELPQTNEQCATDWHLPTFFKKIHKFEASYDIIRARIAAIYESKIGKLRAYTLAAIAKQMQPYFPEEAKWLYEVANEKHSKLSYRISIAQLSGNKASKKLVKLLKELAEEPAPQFSDLSDILVALK